MKAIFLISATFFTSVFGLCACQSENINSDAEMEESRWFNVNVFEKTDSVGNSYYDLVFDIEGGLQLQVQHPG